MKKILFVFLVLPMHAMAAEFTCQAVFSADEHFSNIETYVQASSLSQSSRVCADKVVQKIQADQFDVYVDPQNKATCTLTLAGSYSGYSLVEQILPWKPSADSKKFEYQTSLQECLARAINQIEQGYTYSRRYGRIKSQFNVDIQEVYFTAKLYHRHNQKPMWLSLAVESQ